MKIKEIKRIQLQFLSHIQNFLGQDYNNQYYNNKHFVRTREIPTNRILK